MLDLELDLAIEGSVILRWLVTPPWLADTSTCRGSPKRH